MATVYRIERLTKIYKGSDRKANHELTLDINEGEIFGLLGPNGAGKSTLVNQIAGLVRPTSGAIQIYGMGVVRRPSVIPDYVAIQAQQSGVLNDLYPEEALLCTAQLRGLAPAPAAANRGADGRAEARSAAQKTDRPALRRAAAAGRSGCGGPWLRMAIVRPRPAASNMRHSLRAQQCLDRAALVHRTVALRYLLQWQRQIEDLARIDRPAPDQVDQLGEEAAPQRRSHSATARSTYVKCPYVGTRERYSTVPAR